MSDESVFSVDEAGRRLGLTRHQIYRRIQNGKIHAVVDRDGRRRFVVPESEIQRYLAGGSSEPEDTGALLRSAEVATKLGLSVEMVRRLCEEGGLAHRRSRAGRGHYLIPRASLDEYLSRNS
jgi:excisionase family DNA binding protein